MMGERIVVSGAPGTGKSTVAALLAESLDLALLSLDDIKEALGDSLGLGDERWSDALGDAAAEVIFRVAPAFPGVVAEGWWRRERRVRAIAIFQGWLEVFCHCDPEIVDGRVHARAARRHPVHRDVINPGVLDLAREAAAIAEPLDLGAGLVRVDTSPGVDSEFVVTAVKAALPSRRRG